MRPPRQIADTPVLLWFGLFGAPAAWAGQHVAGYALTTASCAVVGRGSLPFHSWTIAVTAAAATTAALAEAAAIAMFVRTRDAPEEPPGSRVHFLAVVGMTIGPLFLAIILMSGLGALLLPRCVQG